jgi:hypothetical protein
MPLLLIAVITHIVYRAISNGLDWTGEASRRAWGASLAHSRSLADRMRQRMTDTLDAWDQDPRGRRYAATGVRLALGTGRLLGRIGLGTLFGTAKAIGAVSRALAGGALATGGLLGSLAGSARWGARAGAEWWRSRHGSRGWRWLDWFPSWAENKADDWTDWGNVFPGETGPDPYDEARPAEPDPAEGPQAQPTPDAGPKPKSKPGPRPQPDPSEPFDQYDNFDTSFNAKDWYYDSDDDEWRRKEDSPEPDEPKVVVVGWGDPIEETAGNPTTHDPTPVGSSTAGAPAALGTATAVLDRPASPVTEGDSMPTDLMPATGGAVAPLSSAADGMQYEQAQAFLQEQERRARELASLAEQIHTLQLQLMQAASLMGGDHAMAEAALARFGIQAPNVADAIGLLQSVASPAPAEDMVTTYMALDAVASGCNGDASNLQGRFGTAWETMQAERADGQFLNG